MPIIKRAKPNAQRVFMSHPSLVVMGQLAVKPRANQGAGEWFIIKLKQGFSLGGHIFSGNAKHFV